MTSATFLLMALALFGIYATAWARQRDWAWIEML
jgi:hypothetical protein